MSSLIDQVIEGITGEKPVEPPKRLQHVHPDNGGQNFNLTFMKWEPTILTVTIQAKNAAEAEKMARAQIGSVSQLDGEVRVTGGIGLWRPWNAVNHPTIEKPKAVVDLVSVYDTVKDKLVSGAKSVLSLPKK